MSLGTRVLLLTLALVLGLSGAVIWLVTSSITSHETQRAHTAIKRTIRLFADRINERQRQIQRDVQLVMEAPHHRALLEQLSQEDTDEDWRRHTLAQLRDEILGRTIQTILTTETGGPAFHLLLDDFGDVLLAGTGNDENLAEKLAIGDIVWPFEQVIKREPLDSQRRYVWVHDRLYLAFGVPLSVEISRAAAEGEALDPATHALFCGVIVDDAWLEHTLAIDDDEAIPLGGWFLIDGDVVACGGSAMENRPGGLPPARTLVQAEDSTEMHVARFKLGTERFLGTAAAFEPAPAVLGSFIVASSVDAALAPLRRLQRIIAGTATAAALAAVLACRRVARMIAGPVQQLVAGTERVARGEFGVTVATTRMDELGQLAQSFTQMAAGLQQRDLIKETFGKFVDPKIVEGFLADPARLRLGGEKRIQTVMFSDLANFTSLSERMDPDELVRLLNHHLGATAEIVAETQGIVDKFIGDAVMAFWGPPLDERHAEHACRAAIGSVRVAERLAREWRAIGRPEIHVRVGIATGEVLVGNIGAPSKYNYTVMGDAVNLGSRLEGLNKTYETKILADEQTARTAGVAIIMRRIDTVRVLGRQEPVKLYEIGGTAEGDAGAGAGQYEAYTEALRRYEGRDWSGARGAFERLARECADDGPARVMARRCAAFMRQDPGHDWDGVWQVLTK